MNKPELKFKKGDLIRVIRFSIPSAITDKPLVDFPLNDDLCIYICLDPNNEMSEGAFVLHKVYNLRLKKEFYHYSNVLESVSNKPAFKLS